MQNIPSFNSTNLPELFHSPHMFSSVSVLVCKHVYVANKYIRQIPPFTGLRNQYLSTVMGWKTWSMALGHCVFLFRTSLRHMWLHKPSLYLFLS